MSPPGPSGGSPAGPRRGGRGTVLVVGLLVVLVNLPLLHSTWTDRRIDREGVDVVAAVTDTGELAAEDPAYVVAFRLDPELDPEQREWSARLERSAYDEAVADEQVAVRVVPGTPGAQRVVGQVDSDAGLVLTLAGDGVLLVLGLLLWRHRRTTRGAGELRLRATEDVERARPSAVGVERLSATSWVVVGEVCEIGDDEIVLEAGARRVRVELAGHRNPVGHQQPARVVGQVVG